MICEKCQTYVADGTSFCPKCGHMLVEETKEVKKEIEQREEDIVKKVDNGEIKVDKPNEDKVGDSKKEESIPLEISNKVEVVKPTIDVKEEKKEDIITIEKPKNDPPISKIIIGFIIVILIIVGSWFIWKTYQENKTKNTEEISLVHFGAYDINIPQTWIYELVNAVIYMKYNKWSIKTTPISISYSSIINDKTALKEKINNNNFHINKEEEKTINKKDMLIFDCTRNGDTYYLVYTKINDTSSLITDIINNGEYNAIEFNQILEAISSVSPNSTYLQLSEDNDFISFNSTTLTTK
ncbi:MAG: zinc ribbon domain-containing protein [bacterium]|nr:zinc ribbon domain-containing protein [bacterium]